MAAVAVGTSMVLAQSSEPMSWSSTTWNTFVADVTVQTRSINAAGATVGMPPGEVKFHWERAKSGAGWKTVVTYEPRTIAVTVGASRQDVIDPFAVARVEDDEDGTPIRMFDREGHRLQPPSLDVLTRWTGASAATGGAGRADTTTSSSGVTRRFVGSGETAWISAFAATPQQKAARRTRLAQQFVNRGRVGRYDRYTRAEADRTREILADPGMAVPMEVNLLSGAKRLSHLTVNYQIAADGTYVRRSVHAEAPGATAGQRAVVDTTYANVRLERR
jgi:hypothetical protein